MKGGAARIFKIEAKRFFFNKPVLIILASVILLTICCTSIFHFRYDAYDYSEGTKEEMLSSYRSYIGGLQTQIINENYNSLEQLKSMKNNVARYQYYIDTDTTEYQYMDITYLELRTAQFPNVSYAFCLLMYMAYVLLVLTILFFVYVFAADYSAGTMKNVLVAPLKRRSVFCGKMLFAVSVTVGIWLVVTAVAAVFGCLDGGSRVLLNSGGYYYSVQWSNLFAAKALGILANMLLLGAITALAGIATRNCFLAAAIPTVSYLMLLGILLYANAHCAEIGKVIIKGSLLINAQMKWVSGLTSEYIAILCAHLIISALLSVQSIKIIKKQNI